jgi:hypothetical protein
MRRCLLPPIREFADAADLLAKAADALLVADLEACASHLVAADMRPLREFHYRVAGPASLEIHRRTGKPTFIPVPKENRPRMPSASASMAIMARDGFRCRFCESRVVIRRAAHIFKHFVPEAARQGPTNETRHFGLGTITASIDHLVPYSRGGTNDPGNLLTACGPCQFGRNVYTLDEVELANPLDYPPILDDWDGLTRLLVAKPKRRAAVRSASSGQA